ncbi:MAG TPA: hypothetical protein VHW71_15395 [Steroidobacteraceae bacterium]|nr:hypothetical protein [Steroidobacteraceae bacterium]
MRVTGPYAPLFGIWVGALGGLIYWLAAQLWPSSVAVILAMTATALLTMELRPAAATQFDLMGLVLCLLIKYNALMGLSAAKLPFAVPPNVALGLIMICGYAASYALLVSMMATASAASTPKIGHGALFVALAVGFAPAALLGIPGLIGLAAAILLGIGLIAFLRRRKIAAAGKPLDLSRLVCEACFYLGALASWRFV